MEQPVDSTAVSQQDIEIGLHDSFDFAAVTILFEHQGDEESSRCNTVRPVGWKRSPAMLVLSRQRDESIIIGDNIVITIVDIRGDKVRLGIEAPTEIPVHRQEVYEAIQRENAKADAEGARTPPRQGEVLLEESVGRRLRAGVARPPVFGEVSGRSPAKWDRPILPVERRPERIAIAPKRVWPDNKPREASLPGCPGSHSFHKHRFSPRAIHFD